MTASLRTGEVFVAVFPFTSGQSSKPRPVLVLRDFGADVLICRITSAPPGPGPLDVVLRQWQKAGLLKPSTALLARVVTAEKPLLHQRIGAVSADDLRAIRTAWNKLMRL